jgi:dipeptidyl aminopeptidase/acylaminoacyl peptidase
VKGILGPLVLLGLASATFTQATMAQDAADSRRPMRILFESYDNQNWDLWSMRADGTERTNVTATPDIHELYPQASPDGQRIAFLVDEPKNGETHRSLWVMNADGSDRRLVSNAAREATWSPDGKRLAFPKQLRQQRSLLLQRRGRHHHGASEQGDRAPVRVDLARRRQLDRLDRSRRHGIRARHRGD